MAPHWLPIEHRFDSEPTQTPQKPPVITGFLEVELGGFEPPASCMPWREPVVRRCRGPSPDVSGNPSLNGRFWVLCPEIPMVADDLMAGPLALHWLPHPTSGPDGPLDVVGGDVDGRCHSSKAPKTMSPRTLTMVRTMVMKCKCQQKPSAPRGTQRHLGWLRPSPGRTGNSRGRVGGSRSC